MLSNPTSSIQRRRQVHRRQNSTPVIFEAPNIRPLPANASPQKRGHRRGMSLDQKPLLLPSSSSQFPVRSPINHQHPISPSQDLHHDDLVGITNTGQNSSQHAMQVAQQHRLAQPGSQQPQQYHSIPQHQHQHQHQQQPQAHSPVHLSSNNFYEESHPSPTTPSEQQLKDLEQHIQSVYGAYGTVVIQLHHTPVSTPPKPPPLPAPENLDLAPMPASFGDVTSINLDPPGGSGFGFVENPESPHDYASSYYSPEAISPQHSPETSPHQKTMDSFMEDLCTAGATPQLSFGDSVRSFADSAHFLNSSHGSSAYEPILSPTRGGPVHMGSPQNGTLSVAGLNLDATIEDTGISPEEVAKYISEQDPISHRWTCLFPECGKDFGRRENIRSHVQTHLGDRQYRCNHCFKCFVRQHDLKRHAKIHTGDKPYKCPCGGGFARQDALTRHRQRGTCEGAFPGAVRKACKRGRPKKKRPDMEDRLDKARKTRERAKYAESVSDGSDSEFPPSPAESAAGYEAAEEDMRKALTQTTELESDPFSFNTASSPFSTDSPGEDDTFEMAQGEQNDALFRFPIEHFSQTPPASPSPKSSVRSQSGGSSSRDHHAFPLSSSPLPTAQHHHHQFDGKTASPRDIMASPSDLRSSSAFTTPPTSPSCRPDAVEVIPKAAEHHHHHDAFDDRAFGDIIMATLSSEQTSLPAMDMSMFCVDTDMFGGSGQPFDSEEAMKGGMAWIDAL